MRVDDLKWEEAVSRMTVLRFGHVNDLEMSLFQWMLKHKLAAGVIKMDKSHKKEAANDICSSVASIGNALGRMVRSGMLVPANPSTYKIMEHDYFPSNDLSTVSLNVTYIFRT